MRIARRHVIASFLVIAIGWIGGGWIASVASSFSAARKAPPVAYVMPRDLADSTVSPAPGMKLSYLGFDFEIPWNDLDEATPRVTPSDHSDRAILRFRSGLLLELSRLPVRNFPDFVSKEYGMPAQQVDSVFGSGAATSDYLFHKGLYEFTPERMHYWAVSPSVHSSEQLALMMKSFAPSKSAETGVFKVQNQYCRGFQLGDPAITTSSLRLDLFFDDGGVEVIIRQVRYGNPARIAQSEINRIVQSLRKSASPRHAAG